MKAKKTKRKKYLLVPINFDDKGAGVIAYSVALAQELNLKIKLLHVLTVQGVPAPVEAHAGSVTYNVPAGEHLEQRQTQAEERLVALSNRVTNESDVPCDYSCKTGFVDIQILKQTESGRVEMVVMGTPQQNTLLNQLLGSRSLKVINHSEVPVLLVPNHVSYYPLQNIVVGANYENLDGNENKWLNRLASLLDATLHFVRVASKVDNQERLKFKGFQKQLSKLQTNNGRKHTCELIEEQSVDHGLRNYRQNNHADLIALQRSTKSGWDHLFSQNVSKELALETSVPLLIH